MPIRGTASHRSQWSDVLRFIPPRTGIALVQFNLSGEIKYIQGVDGDWPHPSEWLKRTDGNDWVYYSIAGYHRILDTLGEYYLPCLPYPLNSVWTYNPFNDAATLNQLGKPLNPGRIEEAFLKMLEINRTRLNVEITANFLMGDQLTNDHYDSLIGLIRDRLPRYHSKGAIYFSPLDSSGDNRELLLNFFKIKTQSRLPTFLYLIQRL